MAKLPELFDSLQTLLTSSSGFQTQVLQSFSVNVLGHPGGEWLQVIK